MMIKNCKFDPILIDSCCLRKGILLQLTREDGKVASAEISPLPGYSEETLEDALKQLRSLTTRLLTKWWTKQALHYLENLGLYPSVHFGVESALLDLLEDSKVKTPCKKYALLFGSPEEILIRAKEIQEEGYTEAKIKLGHISPDRAHRLIHQLGDQFHLRLDLNRKWTLEESLKFCSSYPENFFEYVEEPASDPKKLIDFPYPYALDETLRDHKDLSPFLNTKNLKALIIKPTLIYPFNSLIELGPKIILSSSFESPIGIKQIERLIDRIGLSENYHGLDTLRYFENHYAPLSHSPLETATS